MPAPANLVHETTTSTGTGNLTLTNVNGKNNFNTAFGTGGTNVFDYFISNREAGEWERGTGHLSSSSTLVRDTVIQSTNSNAAVNFSSGTKDVMNDIPAALQVQGPGSSTDNAIPRWDGTTGALVQGSGVVIDDSNNITGAGTIDVGNSDTTLSRAAAGVLAVESDNLIRASADSATQSNQESASSTTKFVSPGTQQYHPSAAKAWGQASASALVAGYNVASITDQGVGDMQFNFSNNLSAVTAATAIGGAIHDMAAGIGYVENLSVGSCRIRLRNSGSLADPTGGSPNAFCFAVFGDL